MERIVHNYRKGTCKMNNLKTLVYVEAQDRFTEMSDLKVTDEEYKAAADVTIKLVDRAIKMEEVEAQNRATELKERELKLQAEANRLKEKELEEARELKEKELEEAHKSSIRDTVRDIVRTVVPPIVLGCLAVGLTIYERTEVTTSTATREIWKRVFRLS